MASISFTKEKDATPIAVVRNGKFDGNILYLHNNENQKQKGKKVDAERFIKELSFIRPSKRVKVLAVIQEEIQKDTPVSQFNPDLLEIKEQLEKVRPVYEIIKNKANEDSSIELDDEGTFVPIPSPDPNKRGIYYCAGMSGSGKSWFARNIAENYKKLFPEREIYLISKLNNDETLDTMTVGRPKRISLDSLLQDPPDLEEFEKCLVIADDFDTLNAPYDKIVLNLLEDICAMGRHHATSLVICSHNLSNYKKTRLILAESDFLVFYPTSTAPKALKYVAETYAGLGNEEIQEMRRNGRWTLTFKRFPPYTISAKKASLVTYK